jgi:hypothetical protein
MTREPGDLPNHDDVLGRGALEGSDEARVTLALRALVALPPK